MILLLYKKENVANKLNSLTDVSTTSREGTDMLKVVQTPWTNFCLCNIWVISRRNVIYLNNKKPHLDRLFHSQTF